MKTPVYGLVLLLLLAAATAAQAVERRELGNLVLEGIPEIPPQITDKLWRYQNTRAARFRGWVAGGSGMIVSTRFADTTQLHHVAIPGGARRQLTFFAEPVGGVAVSPVAPRLLFTKDTGGDEFYQVYELDLATGEHRLLSDGESRNGGVTWSADGQRFAYYSTRRNGRDLDIYVADVTAPDRPVRVVALGGNWYPVDFSPDGRRLLVEKYVSVNESTLHVVDVASRELQQVHPVSARIGYGSAAWAADGKGLYLTSDEASEFLRLRFYDLRTLRMTELAPDLAWDVDEIELSRDGRLLAYVVNEDAVSALYLRDTDTGEVRRVPDLPVGQVYALKFDATGANLALVLNTPQTPGDVYVLDTAELGLTRWTYSEVGGLDTDRLVVPTLVHYPTFDTVGDEPRQIPALYYRPATGSAPFPVIVVIHGGPEGQTVPAFSALTQYYVNELGAAVIAPNVRGSAGYGKSYLDLDNGMLREDSVRDIGALLDWIATQEDLDAGRIAVRGGSYGGYMVLAAMMHYGDRLACGVEVVGISNFVTFLENTEDYRRDRRRQEYGDERDPEMRAFLESISPVNHADRITKPLFVAQGLNDPRVPASESAQILAAIRANGGEAWYMLARDEGHGFRRKTNRDFYYGASALFLERCLAPREPAASPTVADGD